MVRGERLGEVQVELGRHEADVPLHVPDRLPRSAAAAEEPDVIRIRLRVVAAQQAQEGGLARTVRPDDGPPFARAHRPRHAVEDRPAGVADGDIGELEDRRRPRSVSDGVRRSATPRA